MDPCLCTASGFTRLTLVIVQVLWEPQLQHFHTDEIITNKMLIILSHKTVISQHNCSVPQKERVEPEKRVLVSHLTIQCLIS